MRFITILLAALVSVVINAQAYEPIPVNSSWRFASLNCEADAFDEVILLRDGIHSNNGAPIELGLCVDNDIQYQYYGHYRHDSSNTKLWYVDTANQYQELIMDLNMEVGDTFALNEQQFLALDSNGWVDQITVKRILYDEENRKTIVFNELIASCANVPIDTIKFIEGIGPNYGFFRTNIGGRYYDGQLLYCIRDGSKFDIYYDSTSIEQLGYFRGREDNPYTCTLTCESGTSVQNVSNFPFLLINPISTDLPLNLEGLTGDLSIYSIDGRLLLSQKNVRGSIDLSPLKGYRGIIFVRLRSDQNTNYVSKLLVR